MTNEIITTSYMGREMQLPVSKRIGDWVLSKTMYGYTVYHAPEGVEPRSIPSNQFRANEGGKRGVSNGLSYRAGLAALAEIAGRFPSMGREKSDIVELRDYMQGRK